MIDDIFKSAYAKPPAAPRVIELSEDGYHRARQAPIVTHPLDSLGRPGEMIVSYRPTIEGLAHAVRDHRATHVGPRMIAALINAPVATIENAVRMGGAFHGVRPARFTAGPTPHAQSAVVLPGTPRADFAVIGRTATPTVGTRPAPERGLRAVKAARSKAPAVEFIGGECKFAFAIADVEKLISGMKNDE